MLRGLGIQTSTSSPYYIMSPTTTFISTTRIQDIVIHEAFKGLEVRFYLAVIVEGATEVVVVFPVYQTPFVKALLISLTDAPSTSRYTATGLGWCSQLSIRKRSKARMIVIDRFRPQPRLPHLVEPCGQQDTSRSVPQESAFSTSA